VGLYILGSVRIEATPEQIVTAALILDSVSDRYPGADIAEEIAVNSGDLMVKSFNVSSFSEVEKTEDADTITYIAEYMGMWWEGYDFVIHLAAESGMKVEGSFRAQERGVVIHWLWKSEGGRAIRTEATLIPLPEV